MVSGRVQDVADIARMLGQADPAARDGVRAMVGEYAPADVDDLESLIVLGQLEMRRDAG